MKVLLPARPARRRAGKRSGSPCSPPTAVLHCALAGCWKTRVGRAQEAWGGGVWPEGGSLARRLRPGMRGKERRGGRCRRHQRREATQPSAQAAASLRVAPGPGVSFGGAPPRAPGTESSRLRGSIPAQGATRREPSRARPHNARRGEEGDAVPSWTSRNKADGPQSLVPEWVAAARPRLLCCRS